MRFEVASTNENSIRFHNDYSFFWRRLLIAEIRNSQMQTVRFAVCGRVAKPINGAVVRMRVTADPKFHFRVAAKHISDRL